MRLEKPTEFEFAVLRYIAVATADPNLMIQLESVMITDREHTGVGCYSKLVVPESAPAVTAAYGGRGPVDGPSFESPAVEFGGGTLLWFSNGRAETLEVYAHGNKFPADHAELLPFTLSESA